MRLALRIGTEYAIGPSVHQHDHPSLHHKEQPMFYDVFGPSWGSELREMQRLFDDFGRFGSRSRRPGDGTALNVWANDESVAVTAELPGIAPESLNLSIVGDTLT